jgi:flagellar hook-basal body complex protein FliE
MIEALALDATNKAGVSALATVSEATVRPAAMPTSTSFDSVLGDIATNAINTIKTGEAAAISGLQGSASAQQVVDAVMSAERTLQLAVAVRDKVVQAYQEVSRMAI